MYITDNAYTRQEVLDMEQGILQTLSFRITVPTAFVFLSRFSKALVSEGGGEKLKWASSYYMERTLQVRTLWRGG